MVIYLIAGTILPSHGNMEIVLCVKITDITQAKNDLWSFAISVVVKHLLSPFVGQYSTTLQKTPSENRDGCRNCQHDPAALPGWVVQISRAISGEDIFVTYERKWTLACLLSITQTVCLQEI